MSVHIPTPGTVVASQDGNDHLGEVLPDPHPLEGWVWVQWEHIGRHDEFVTDLTVVEVPS